MRVIKLQLILWLVSGKQQADYETQVTNKQHHYTDRRGLLTGYKDIYKYVNVAI